MKLEKRVPSGREKDEASLQLLEKLREQLYSSNLTVLRQSAFNLSWLQEDGLDILREAMLSPEASRKTKGAASYGLRKMRGRMRKPAREVLSEGTRSSDPGTVEISRNALRVLEQKKQGGKHKRPRKPSPARFEIRDLPPKGQKTLNKSRRFFGHSSSNR